jgi:DNA polymerase-3 subunit epsilon
MFKIVDDYKLCQKLTGLYTTKTSCFKYDVKECNGACVEEETPESYNKRVTALIEKHSYTNKNMLLIDRGRDVDEKSAILIENGVFKGLGYFDLNHQITNRKVLQSLLTPMSNTKDNQHIIQSYMRRNKRLKVIELT